MRARAQVTALRGIACAWLAGSSPWSSRARAVLVARGERAADERAIRSSIALVPPSTFHGVHGLAFDAQDRLYAGSVVGHSVYRVDTPTGTVERFVGAPEGMADDLVFLADGTMVWTSISAGRRARAQGRRPGRASSPISSSVNSINVRKSDGRLFVAQVFGGDGVWEIDPAGAQAAAHHRQGSRRLQRLRHRPRRHAVRAAVVQAPGRAHRSGHRRAHGHRGRLRHAGRGEFRFEGESVRARYRARRSRSRRHPERQEAGRRETRDLARQSRDRLARSHVRFEHGGQRHPGSRRDDRRGAPGRQGHAREPARHRCRHRRGRDTLYVADVFAFRSVDASTGQGHRYCALACRGHADRLSGRNHCKSALPRRHEQRRSGAALRAKHLRLVQQLGRHSRGQRDRNAVGRIDRRRDDARQAEQDHRRAARTRSARRSSATSLRRWVLQSRATTRST